MTRRAFVDPLVALLVLVIELGATLGSVAGEPFSPVTGWGSTRPADGLAFTMVVLGCLSLAFSARFPLAVAATATGSYLVFALRDYELGMFLPPMVVIFTLLARDRHRLAAILCAGASVIAAIGWIAGRTVGVTDAGVALLAWAAFGSVLGVFFTAPLLVGEIVRARALLRSTGWFLAGASTRRGGSTQS